MQSVAKSITKLIATQAFGVTMGIIGAGLIAVALDKATKNKKYVVFHKLPFIKGELHSNGIELIVPEAVVPIAPFIDKELMVFDDQFSGEALF